MPRPACFSVSWDPEAPVCRGCRFQGPCVTVITEDALAQRINDRAGLIRKKGLSPAAAEIVEHALHRIRGRGDDPRALEESATLFDRWAQERETRPAIARIQPGEKLVRRFAGRDHEVTCGFGYWLYAGERHPTLASVVRAIAGARQYPKRSRRGGRAAGTRAGAICSAARFFKLRDREASE